MECGADSPVRQTLSLDVRCEGNPGDRVLLHHSQSQQPGCLRVGQLEALHDVSKRAGRVAEQLALGDDLQLPCLGAQGLGRGLLTGHLAAPPEHSHRDRDNRHRRDERGGCELPPILRRRPVRRFAAPANASSVAVRPPG